MPEWLTVFLKECRETLRDRRTLSSALLLGPLLGPMMFAVMVSVVLEKSLDDVEQALTVPVYGAERAPELMAWLATRNIEARGETGGLAEARRQVEDGEEPVTLHIPEAFAGELAAGRPAPVQLVTDGSERGDAPAIGRVRAALGAWSATLAGQRLQLRGVDPRVISPLALDDVDVSTATGRSLILLGIVTYFLLFSILTGGLYLAIDATAGERERKSLEPLFTLPVSRESILFGKLAATFAFMSLSLVITLAAFAVSLRFIDLERLGMVANFGPAVAAKTFLLLLPFAAFGAALLTLVASFTRSYREAQAWLSAVLIVPTVPIIFAGIYGLSASLPAMLVPSLSQHLLVTELMRGEPLVPVHVLVSAAATLTVAAGLVAGILRFYRRETILG
jgi:sodium transport system permease protein